MVQCLHVFLRCSFVVLVISLFICCRAGKVGSLVLGSSCALIFSNISAGSGSVLIRCRPEGICRDAAFRMMVRKIFSPFWQFDGRRLIRDPGMSLNCVPNRVCRKSASRPGYVVKVRTDPGYVVKQCPRIVMNKIFDWH